MGRSGRSRLPRHLHGVQVPGYRPLHARAQDQRRRWLLPGLSWLKRCYECGAEKPATTEFFHAHPFNQDRLAGRCRPCAAIYSAQWKASHPNYDREWCAANRDRLADKHRRWIASKPGYEAAKAARQRAEPRALQARSRPPTREAGTEHLDPYAVPDQPRSAFMACKARAARTDDPGKRWWLFACRPHGPHRTPVQRFGCPGRTSGNGTSTISCLSHPSPSNPLTIQSFAHAGR